MWPARRSRGHIVRKGNTVKQRACRSRFTASRDHTRSIAMAMPWPTPMHIVHSA
jgi:hypothetical protein